MSEDVLTFAIAATALVLIASHIRRMLQTRARHSTLREAMTLNSPILSQLVQTDGEDATSARGDGRTAAILIALALALAIAGFVQGGERNIRDFLTLALFPGFVGAALLIRERF